MKRFVAVLICMTGCASADAAEQLAACLNSPAPLKYRAPVKDLSGELPIPDYLDTIEACQRAAPPWQPAAPSQPAPQSAWLESELRLYQDVLARRPVDVLVVPFQVQGYGLDRIERALLTAELAYALGDASNYRIADPFLVTRALGEGARRIEPVAVSLLARKLGAKMIVIGYVGQDLHHTFTLTLQVEQIEESEKVHRETLWHHDWRAVPFSDERMPALAFNEMLPDVLRTLPLTLVTRNGQLTAHPTKATLKITRTPRELAASASVIDPTLSAASFDLLGALGPARAELARERAFERALVVSFRQGQATPKDHFLRAYALTQLWRRPAALAVLAGQNSAESIALSDILNGNLPAAQKSVARVPQSLERLLLDIGLRDLESSYGRKKEAMPRASERVFGSALAQWRPLVELRGLDPDPWAVPDPLVIKGLLDQTFPVAGLDVNSVVRGSEVTRNVPVDDVEVDLTNERHVRHTAATLDPVDCCRASQLHPTQWDVLWLLEGLAEARIADSLVLATDMRGLPEDALEAIRRYEPLLGGQPALESSRSSAAVQMYQKSADDTRASWLKQAEQGAMIAARFSPGQNAIAYQALLSMGIPSHLPEASNMVDAYGYDYPRRPFWPMWFFGIEPGSPKVTALALEALAFSVNNPAPLSWLPPGSEPGHRDAAIASLGSRFLGDPHRPAPAGEGGSSSAPTNMLAHLEGLIHSDPESWDNYEALGEYLVRSGGSYRAARDAFLRYPGFREPRPENPVALSNYAYEAGSVLYWQGVPSAARPLYKISADLQTGSEASMSSDARLHIMDGDYLSAAQTLFERATRYNSPQAYRDYLSFLYAFGKSKEAWEGFSQIKASYGLPQVWVAALVGQQMQGLNSAAVREWLMRPEIRDARFHTVRFAPYYAILWHATERTPPPDLGSFVEQLEGPAVAKIDVDGLSLLVPSPFSEGSFQLVRPSAFRADKVVKLPPDTPIKSELAYFADAYAAVRLGDYENAVLRFVALADRYPVEGYPLAYFAYAAAKTGDKERLEQYLEPRKANPDFDVWLARAFFAAARKQNDIALSALQSAFRSRPNTDSRPVLTEYEYAQACEWLFKETADERFKAALLDWARKHQAVQPTHAWAYAIEYAYARPGPERMRALALTLYLDPASDRIKSAPEQERDAAEAWLHEHNPFRQLQGGRDGGSVITMSQPALPFMARREERFSN